MSDISNFSKVKIPNEWPREQWIARRMAGETYLAIAKSAGCTRRTVNVIINNKSWSKSSHDPGIHTWDADFISGESPRDRAFRRFPITSHKPGGWE